MSIPLSPITLTPGIAQDIQLRSTSNIQAVKLSNSTPYDLSISGFGVIGVEIIPAGTEYMLHSERESSGHLYISPVDNTGAGGTGVINIVKYLQDESLPRGNWPVAIPTQKVVAKVTSVNRLTSIGEAVGTQIINLQPAGDAASCVTLTNDGQLVIGDATNHGSVKFDNATITSDGNGKLTVANLVDNGTIAVTGAATFNGAGTGLTVTNNALVSGSLTVTGVATFNAAGDGVVVTNNLQVNKINEATGDTSYLAVSGTGATMNTRLQSGNVINFQIPAGVPQAFIDSNGIHASSGSVVSFN